MLLKISTCLVLLTTPLLILANTIVVSSKSDSGPGTLRQAITDAANNGNTPIDTIIFQIADISRTGRTIILSSELPALTSNLVIDGSTQQGIAIGASTAKVIVEQQNPVTNAGFRFFKIYNAVNVQVFGLFLYNTWWDYPFGTLRPPIIAVDLIAATNVVFGAPGKGNYIRGILYGFNAQSNNIADSSTGLTVQSNIAGLDETGGITSVYPYNAVLYGLSFPFRLKNVRNIRIGGQQLNEGNSIHGSTNEILATTDIGNGFVDIRNNNFNLTITGQVDLDGSSGNQNKFTIGHTSASNDYAVTYRSNNHNGNLILGGLTKHFEVQGNKIFVPYFISSNPIRLQIHSCSGGGIIGGSLPGEPNEIFTNNWSGQNYYAISSPDARGAINVNNSEKITITKNAVYNTAYFASSIHNYQPSSPYVRIDSTGINFVRGKATPNCTIEVFIDDPWVACEGKNYLGNTTSAADSTWQFIGVFDTVIVATATNAQGATSGFSTPELRTNNVVVQDATCGVNNGSITGMRAIGYDRAEWRHLWKPTHNTDSVVSNDFDAYNLAPGKYYFHAWLGNSCRSYYAVYTIGGIAAPTLNETAKQVVHPSCGQNTGSITNVSITNYDYSVFRWKNTAGMSFPAIRTGNNLSLQNAPPGNYKLIITDTIGGCSDSTEWISLVNQSGPSLNTNALNITHTTCRQANGAIQGIQIVNGVSPFYYRWEDSTGTMIANTTDLQNIKAGKYRLKFKDGSACDTLVTIFLIVQNNGTIIIDSSAKNIQPSGCSLSNGSITGIIVTGSNNIQWTSSAGMVVSNNVTLQNVASGGYRLTATNSFGCTAIADFAVPNAAFQPISVTGYQVTPANCDLANGSIHVTQFSATSSAYQMQWKDSLTGTVYSGTLLNNLGTGTYQLIATDAYNCTQKIFSATITQLGKPQINATAVQRSSDTCNLTTGSINGLMVSGGTGQPFTWKWFDATGTAVNPMALSAGSYHAVVSDASGCEVNSAVYDIGNQDIIFIAPIADDHLVQRGSSVKISVTNVGAYDYLLFDSLTAVIPIQKNNTGVFVTPPNWYEKHFYLRAERGSCTSNLVPVRIQLFDETKLFIPNVFSPNGDGINDTWRLNVQGYLQLEYLVLYDRYGKEIYRTDKPYFAWDGKVKGKVIAPGTYYYILKAKGSFNEMIRRSGYVTILR